MNTLDEQIALIQAHQVQRAIQCRTTDVVSDKDLVWIPITKDHRFNFQDFEYRLAPVKEECWLVYDIGTKAYRKNVFDAQQAAEEAIDLGRINHAPDRFIPVRMIPAES